MTEALTIILPVVAGAVGAVWLALRITIRHLYQDAKADRDRLLAALETNTAELMTCREERSALRAEREAARAELQRLNTIIETKLEAAQPRDEHGRFLPERDTERSHG